MKFVRYLIHHQPVAFGIAVLCLGALIWFGGNFAADWVYFHDPAHRNQTLEPWMTARYIGMSYGLPREEMMLIFEFGDQPPQGERVAEVLERLGLTLEELQVRVDTAKAAQLVDRELNHLAREAEPALDRLARELRDLVGQEQRQ